jgi:hypothetical protein
MVLKRRATDLAATSVSGVETAKSRPNLKRLIESLEMILPGSVAESMPIPDAMLTEDLKAGLADVAELIGHAKYSPDATATLYCVVDSESGTTRLYPPSLKAYDDGAVIRWDDELIHLSADTSISSDLYRSFRADSTYFLLVDIKGYCFPVRIPIDREKAKDPAFQLQFATFGTIEQLSPHLQRGEPILKWSEIPDKCTVLIYSAQPVYDRAEGKTTEVKYVLGVGNIREHEESNQFYLPGEWADWCKVDWACLDNPIELERIDQLQVEVSALGKTLEVKSAFTYKKVSELEIGVTYTLTGYTIDHSGRFGDKVVFAAKDPTGSEILINGNSYMCNRILKAPGTTPTISPDSPATLVLNSVTTKQDGKRVANCVMVLPEDASNPFLERIAKYKVSPKAS